MASGLGISMAQAPKVVDDIVFDVIQSQFSSAVAIHITTVMLEAAKSTWVKPSSFPISSKRLVRMYHMQEDSVEVLLHHHALNSLVVSSSSKTCR